MKIRVVDIEETEKEIAFVEEVSGINDALAKGASVDYRLVRDMPVEMGYYRAGQDLLFHGKMTGSVSGTCARCLEPYPFSVDEPFTFALKPARKSEREISPDELVESFYDGDEVDLSPLLREAVLLALPTRPLCREECAGLCAKCGANLNLGRCDCRDEWVDPRLAVLRDLNLKRD